jgi:hypothetical protein
MPEWAYPLLSQAGPLGFGLAIGMVLGRLWGQSRPPPPPPVNPWEGRACREWDGGERWTV